MTNLDVLNIKFAWKAKGSREKRIVYSQADRKGERGGSAPLAPTASK